MTSTTAKDSEAAKWVAANHHWMNKRAAKVRRRTTTPPAPLPETLNDFQSKVAIILGLVFQGIHNAPIAWERASWWRDSVVVTLTSDGGRFSTYDFDKLTAFVFLCHAARIRGAIMAGGVRSLSLSFHERHASGGMSQRHPNIAEALAVFDRVLPADSPLWYQPPTEGPGDDTRACNPQPPRPLP